MPVQHELERRQRRNLSRRFQSVVSADVFTAPRIRRPLPRLNIVEKTANLSERRNREYLGLGERQRSVVLAAMKPNEDLSDFIYPTPYAQDLVLDIYADKFIGIDDEKVKKRKVKNNQGAAYQAVHKFIESIESLDNLLPTQAERTLRLVEEIRATNPFYADLTVEQIIAMLQRKLTPAQIKHQFEEAHRPPASQDLFVPTKITRLPDIVAVRRELPPLKQRPKPPHPMDRKSKQDAADQKATDGQKAEEVYIPQPKLPDKIHILSRQELAVYCLMLADPKNEDYRYSDGPTALMSFYEDFDPEENLTKGQKREFKVFKPQDLSDEAVEEFSREVNNEVEAFAQMLENHEHTDGQRPSNELHNFILWAAFDPFYEYYTPIELAAVLRRQTPFSEIRADYIFANIPTDKRAKLFGGKKQREEDDREKDPTVLSIDQKYMLALLLQSLSRDGTGANFGIRISDKQKSLVYKIIGSLNELNPEVGLVTQRGQRRLSLSLNQTLTKFFESPEGFLEQVRDEQTKNMLSLLREGNADRILRLFTI